MFHLKKTFSKNVNANEGGASKHPNKDYDFIKGIGEVWDDVIKN